MQNNNRDVLHTLGWNSLWERAWEQAGLDGLAPARVVRDGREIYALAAASGDHLARPSGRLRHRAADRADMPAIGDWVAVACPTGAGEAVIHAILPRRSAFRRKAAGRRTDEQIIAANIDTTLVVTALDADFSVRRIERYLALAWDSGAAPVVVLSKADLCANVEAHVAEVELAAPGAPVCALSALSREGVAALEPHLPSGRTVALVGSSGVGKSTLVNALLGEDRQAVRDVRGSDCKGRHTTTARELIALPTGALLIDTPGMREVALWGDGEGVDDAFADVDQLAECCRFRDCMHLGEPGCAVQQALVQGELDPGRYESYLEMRRELAFLHRKQDEKASRDHQRQWKKISRWIKDIQKEKGKW